MRKAIITFVILLICALPAKAGMIEASIAFKEKNYSMAFVEYMREAEKGNPEAQHRIGKMYAKGKGVQQNDVEAVRWYRKAAEQGHAVAQYDLCESKGVQQDLKEFLNCIGKAGELGYHPMNAIGWKKDSGDSLSLMTADLRWWKKASEWGDDESQVILGNLYYGGEGVEQDYDWAKYWYSKAAEQGNASAQWHLGFMYRLGEGVSKSNLIAVDWFYKSAISYLKGGNREEALRTAEYIGKIEPNHPLLPNLMRRIYADDGGKEKGETDTSKSKVETRSGSGFVVSSHGHIVTNSHVVDGCSAVTVFFNGISKDAKLIKQDKRNDIALLSLPKGKYQAISFRAASPLKQGDEIIVIGYPLHGLLASDMNVTIGIINSLSGIQDDTSSFQISAEVHPGNSGAPVLDKSGNVIGVVYSKVDAVKYLKVTGDLPQNLNFAIKGNIVTGFLESSGVTPILNKSSDKESTASILEKVGKSTVRIECR